MGIGLAIDARDGGGIGGLFRAGDEGGVQHPDQRIEPEQGQRQPRQDEEQPVAPLKVRQLMGQHGIGGARIGQAGGVKQDGAGRHPPADRSGQARAAHQPRPTPAAEPGQGRAPGRAGHGLPLGGPAVQRHDAQHQTSGDEQATRQPDENGETQGRWPGHGGLDRHPGDGPNLALPEGAGGDFGRG